MGEPKSRLAGHPFCVYLRAYLPAASKLACFYLDTANAASHQAWLDALRTAAGVEAATVRVYREFTFSVLLEDEELQCFTVRHSAAKRVHEQLQAVGALPSDVAFPGRFGDGVRDFNFDEANWSRRANELLGYYQALFGRRECVAHAAFKAAMGFGLDDLDERHTRVSRKVTRDPELVRRAMLYLQLTGEVLCPQVEGLAGSRVFLRPQWLVDIMKELVRHDLRLQVDQTSAVETQQPALIKGLGLAFCDKGVLDRRLLPWLWRSLPFSLADKPEEISFLLQLLEQLGLLTLIRSQGSPLYLLPLRLPKRDVHLSMAAASAQAKFSVFLTRVGHAATDMLDGIQHVPEVGLSQAVLFIAASSLVASAVLDAACRVAFDAADKCLGTAAADEHGLTRDDIAAIHLYHLT